LLRLRPELKSGRNEVEYEFLPGHRRRAVWLDPELPATFELMEQVLAGVAAIFPGPYLHIGADEPRGMPDELYASYVRPLRRLVRSLGRQPLGWPASPTGPGAPQNRSAGPPTARASPGTAGCGPRTASPTSAPPPWTGANPVPGGGPRPRPGPA